MSEHVSIHPAARIGSVYLKVRDLDRSVAFYREVIGLSVLKQNGNIAELTADGKTPLLYLEANGQYRVMPERSVSGLYHFAILVPDRTALGLALRNLIKYRIPVGQGDHLVSEALYLNDPDQNGIEIYADRPRDTWRRNESGEYIMSTDPVDVDGLLTVSEGAEWRGLPPATLIGHVHFHVGDLREAERFYCQILGFEITAHYGGAALFVSAGGYHHHIGLNTWAGVGAPPSPEDAVGLRYFTAALPDLAALGAVESRLANVKAAYERDEQGREIRLTDPFGIGIKLVIDQAE
ncbi:VOC family protein [Paenibacillus macerans]|uniref:VOC family protein n=1 Tax=Paenibacillus macerans TaxID=44252 RepID=UPI002DBFB1D0|nr:VOC family protein [Paenibacillus macerans]MEC0330211.1 VOC family protein [Paenibacillus macerans]MED4953892.1 VOC family protein [Paenibacillus macerans]